MSSVYFDHNATTALDSRVLDVMLPWLKNQSGNPTSRHVFGRTARTAIEHARAQVAEACGAYPSQVVFTSCGTEANNFAVKGIAANLAPSQILYSAIEHPCVSRPAIAMQYQAYRSKAIAVNQQGQLDIAHFETLLTTPTCLASVMLANNESGVIQDMANIAEIAKRAGSFVHTDAVQALGKLTLSFNDLNVNAMTVSSHKIHGPQGAAALILDKRLDVQPLLHGGGQERALRSGTENVAAIIGFGMACELAAANVKNFAAHTNALREQFEQGLQSLDVTLFSDKAARIPNTSFFAVAGIEGETLVMALDRKGFAVASGSACSSDSTEPSHVLMAMGVHADLARGAVRVSFGMQNTTRQVANFLNTLKNEILRLKQLTSIAA
ncbi:MAG: cysteine desulfurase [Methylotenera sp. 24-45-7]|jgi:cysteine desulfurase|nr:MAG: cysteine desulfurase [Mehylophilales bacterium 35-46-6]OYY84458.1 MAG: cysteine desulfurase [Methylophilales bacterium 16-45-9]OYZ40607.1 MAG: cysteine desulfurase [Methylotenera sp. 24-45-7]OZA09635.1 MAG: cysteine desulfurase [Methylotenera sp. 17-45-7]HQS43580.1 cysteine desulfurase family protein [Methylotenera sp.]